jgi:tellurite resistance protein
MEECRVLTVVSKFTKEKEMKDLNQAIVDYAVAVAKAEKAISNKERTCVIDVALINLEFARKGLEKVGVNLPIGVPT